MPAIELHIGDDFLPTRIPEEWLGEIVAPLPVQPAADPIEIIQNAFAHPIESPPLARLAQPGQKVSILVDDYTRRTPVYLLLPPVLDALELAGVRQQDITITIALGSHRAMTPSEINLKMGTEIQGRYRVTNVTADREAEMSYLGDSSSGIPIWVLRDLVAADLRIGLGMITPHMDAGFSGGAKIILPGACSLRTVDAFHALAVRQPKNQLGNPQAPLRLELEHFVSTRLPLHFIANVILTPKYQLYQCVAGDSIAAHRVGVVHARHAFGAPVRRRYPLVLANCYPYQHDVWQSMKGLWCGELLTQDGGTLVLLTVANEGHSNYPLLPMYIGQDPETLLTELETGETTDLKAAATGILVGRMRSRIRLALVSQGLTQKDAMVMGFDWYPDLALALEREVSRIPIAKRHACVALIPQAGVTLPLLPRQDTP